MHVLFVHPNFPAQFRCVAPGLAGRYGWTCSFATTNAKAEAPAGGAGEKGRRRGKGEGGGRLVPTADAVGYVLPPLRG